MPRRASKAGQPPPSLSDVAFRALRAGHGRVGRAVGPDVVDRVRCEFLEMPGFSPTLEQAARLFQIDRDACGRILSGLVAEGFLKRTPDGRYRLPAQQ